MINKQQIFAPGTMIFGCPIEQGTFVIIKKDKDLGGKFLQNKYTLNFSTSIKGARRFDSKYKALYSLFLIKNKIPLTQYRIICLLDFINKPKSVFLKF